MLVTPPVNHFHTLVLGGGQGASLARMLAEEGVSVALIEKDGLGGTCTNRGCTPTKAHLSSAKRAHDARTAGALGVHAASVEVDLPAIVKRSQGIVTQFREEIDHKLAALPSLQIFRGEGRFIAPGTAEVQLKNGETQRLSADHIVVAVGAKNQVPPIEGLNEIPWLDHARALQLDTLPEHLFIVGGGYIACEFATMFARFGSRVSLMQKGAQLLGREDPDVAEEVADVLRDEGVTLYFENECTQVSKHGEGLQAHLKDGTQITASHLLIAIGMKPNTENIGLEHLGVKLGEKGEIVVNEFLEAAPNVWALGDCKGGPSFTHIAFNDACALSGRLLHGKKNSTKSRMVPYVVFTDPQVARVGLSETEAREQGLKFRVAKLPVCDTARGVETGEPKGFLKALVGEDDQILGGAFIARDGGEVMAALQIAMQGKLPYTALRDSILAHPTQTEAFNTLFNRWEDDA